MAFSVSVLKELNLVFTRYSGSLDTPQLLKALAATVEHPDYRPGCVETSRMVLFLPQRAEALQGRLVVGDRLANVGTAVSNGGVL